jgi:hypothetical protein
VEDNLSTPVVDNATTPEAGGQDWRTGLSEDIRTNPHLETFKTPNDLAKSWINAQRLIGKEKLPVPTDKDGKEIWDTVYARLGRPDDPKGYKLPELQKPEGFPEFDAKEMEGLLSKAHELGLNNKQMGELYKTFMEGEIARYGQIKEGQGQSKLDAETNLRKEWGRAYEEKILKAKAVLNQHADDDIRTMVEGGLGNDPRFIKFLSNIAGKLSEDGIGGKAQGFAMSPEEAMSEIARIKGEAMTNPKHPYINKEHPEHDMMVEKMNKLFHFANP